MSTGRDPAGAGQPSEEELRAAYEAEVKKIKVEHVLLEDVVTFVNLGMRRTGLAPGTESERDLAQVRLAIESVRALLPLVEQTAPEQVGPIRDALSQLQLAFVRIGGQAEPGAGAAAPGATAAPPPQQPPPQQPPQQQPPPQQPPEPPASKPGEPGPAQRSGRLWIPGQ